MERLSACPLCGNSNFSAYLSCRDYTVSHETFHLQRCAHCGLVLTNPRPHDRDLPKYYQSEAYISHSDKSTNLVGQAYKAARTFTLKWKYKLIQKHSLQKPSSLLDYGCGTGAFLLECTKHGMKIAGVEPSSTARTQANEKTSHQVVSAIGELRDTFDVVSLWHVLEHVSNLNETVTHLRDHLKENGTMFIAVPNLQSEDAKTFGEHWAGYDVPRHLWHFSRNTMEKLLTNHNLNLINVVPMRLDAFYVSLLSEKYRNGTNGIQAMAKAAFEGWRSNRSAKTNGEYSSLAYIVRK
ncbi:MAG: class I SAM-dependent methyltransferase [Cyclobacteriaceae bacterium]